MSFIVEDTYGDFERCPSGVHLARCYRIIDLGTQKSEYMGQTKFLRKVSLGWEVHGTDDDGKKILMKDGRPFAIFKNYTLSWSEKSNLRIELQSWRGKPFSTDEMRRFDLKNILGAWCMLNVVDRPSRDGTKTYSNINGITPVPSAIKSLGMPEAVNPSEIFNLQEPDLKLYSTFSQNLKDKIAASPEWQKMKNSPDEQVQVDTSSDDDIPF
jgi:hypothetical protein